MIKKSVAVILLVSSVCFSQTYINLHNGDGTTQSFNIEEIRKLTFSDITSVEDAKMLGAVIKSFKLLQNYPNPFNPTTTIEYQIPKSGNVEVKIYNISGQLTRTIENGFRNAGTYKIFWDSKNDFGQKVSSGVYIYQVKYDNAIISKKLILIK